MHGTDDDALGSQVPHLMEHYVARQQALAVATELSMTDAKVFLTKDVLQRCQPRRPGRDVEAQHAVQLRGLSLFGILQGVSHEQEAVVDVARVAQVQRTG